MPTTPLKAHQTRADGTPVLRIEVAHSFDHDQAARALALVYAREPLRKSIHALRDGLLRAVELRVLDEPRWVAAKAVEAYRTRLRQLKVFPTAAERQRMLKRLREAQRARLATDPAKRSTAPLVRQPAIWAKHEREDGTPVAIVEQPLYFDHSEAARCLAIVYRDKPEPLRSTNALRLGLQQAGREGLLDELSVTADEQLVEQYRSILVDQGVFRAHRSRRR
ncbi:hypothetical protein [Actinophytocola sp.]|uniref:hypothetical protein n=1 Tax=Actinophytocola sp. TaxID=1872138 RepID=UPI002ED67E7B